MDHDGFKDGEVFMNKNLIIRDFGSQHFEEIGISV